MCVCMCIALRIRGGICTDVGCIIHIASSPGPFPVFQHATLKSWEWACYYTYIIESDVVSECDLVTEGIVGSTRDSPRTRSTWSLGHWKVGVGTSDFVVERSKTDSNIVCHISDLVRYMYRNLCVVVCICVDVHVHVHVHIN